ncbi:MAG: hypothetical protein K4305_08980 [Chlorobium sp.]|uniref:portal protein n=1 Tax=Chlorobium sp. TaxID=1095 RepID=UPI002F401431
MLQGSEPIKADDTSTTDDFLCVARDRYVTATTYWRDNYYNALEDLNFTYIEQWDQATKEARKDRPCLTLNKLPTFIDQVVGDIRQNRPSIKVHPVEADHRVGPQPAGPQGGPQGGKVPNLAGTKDYSEAELRNGLIYNIWNMSDADSHTDTAAQHSVEGGFGFLRVLTAYSDDDTFDQDLLIKSIRNRFSVLFDPLATNEPDFSCANWCFISELMRRKEFNKRYPDAILGDMGDQVLGEDWHLWYNEDMVRVAEYFYREPVKRKLLLLSSGETVWLDEIKPVLDELQARGIEVRRERKVSTYKVMWSKITARSILEKPTEVPFRTIPVVPVLGKEVVIGNQVHYRGLIRYAKDAQKMHNYWLSSATERVALAPKQKFIADAKSVEGFESEWANANTSAKALLRYKARPDVIPPAPVAPPNMPAAELQLALAGSDEIKATTGLYDASMGNQGNETSGKAILARQRQGDRGTFAYIDNLSRALRRVGKLLIDSIPRVYDSERIVRLIFPDGKEDWVTINKTVIDQQTGQPVLVHDISAGKYDCTVSTGPSYQTMRLEAADSLMQFVQAVPAAGGVILDLVAKNMDWPGADEIAKRLKKILPSGTLSEQEMQEEGIEPPQPSPEAQAAMAKAQADIAKAKADEAMAQAKTVEAQAKILEIQVQAAIAGPDTIEETVRNLVADALAEIMQAQAS